jgi:hypothetical protein
MKPCNSLGDLVSQFLFLDRVLYTLKPQILFIHLDSVFSRMGVDFFN